MSHVDALACCVWADGLVLQLAVDLSSEADCCCDALSLYNAKSSPQEERCAARAMLFPPVEGYQSFSNTRTASSMLPGVCSTVTAADDAKTAVCYDLNKRTIALRQSKVGSGESIGPFEARAVGWTCVVNVLKGEESDHLSSIHFFVDG